MSGPTLLAVQQSSGGAHGGVWVDNWRFPATNPRSGGSGADSGGLAGSGHNSQHPPGGGLNDAVAAEPHPTLLTVMMSTIAGDPASFVGPFDPSYSPYGDPVVGGASAAAGYFAVIVCVAAALLLTNLTVIVVIICSDSLKDVIGAYFVSLSASDCLLSVLVLPFGAYTALAGAGTQQAGHERLIAALASGLGHMPDGAAEGPLPTGGAYWLCKLEAYLGVTMITSNICTFMWLAVDRFAALKKPGRYEIEQTFTRCKCWILFSWITSILLCCPTLFTSMAVFNADAKLCMNDWSVMPAYSATLAILVVLPTLLGVCVTYRYIFAKFRSADHLEQEERAVLENDPNMIVVFVIIAVFAVSWAPWFGLRLYESVGVSGSTPGRGGGGGGGDSAASPDGRIRSPVLHFSLLWLGLTGGAWRLVIYVVMNMEFRRRFFWLCRSVFCCRPVCGDRCLPAVKYGEYDAIDHRHEGYL